MVGWVMTTSLSDPRPMCVMPQFNSLGPMLIPSDWTYNLAMTNALLRICLTRKGENPREPCPTVRTAPQDQPPREAGASPFHWLATLVTDNRAASASIIFRPLQWTCP